MDSLSLRTRAQRWLSSDPDPETRATLNTWLSHEDDAPLKQAFGERLAFGTAGLRGLMGPGPSQMNRLVVRQTTAGLGAYLLETQPANAVKPCVVVGYDGRHRSRTFAEDAAGVLLAQGFEVRLTQDVCPTPVLAFAVKHHGAAAGIMITASHNPPAYNGYKVFWQDGAQIIPPHDAGIAAAILVEAEKGIPCTPLSGASLLTWMGAEIFRAYQDAVLAQNRALGGGEGARRLKIAYTALHGVGTTTALKTLARAGFDTVEQVSRQAQPDGDFPTVAFPNPEEKGAMDAVVALAKEAGADLACANDPDADRLAVAVRTRAGDFRLLTGNELGVLLAWWCLRSAKSGDLVVTTVVSSSQLGVMAKNLGVKYVETLTGHKWIAAAAREHEARGGRFLFGYEEALGYRVGSVVCDKDGISALLAICELAEAESRADRTLLDTLDVMSQKFGLFVTAQRTLAIAPSAAAAYVAGLMAQPPSHCAGFPCEVQPSPDKGLWIARVKLGQGISARVLLRPSGTEPKLKMYCEASALLPDGADSGTLRQSITAKLSTFADGYLEELRGTATNWERP